MSHKRNKAYRNFETPLDRKANRAVKMYRREVDETFRLNTELDEINGIDHKLSKSNKTPGVNPLQPTEHAPIERPV